MSRRKKKRASVHERPQGGLELWWWLFMRLSGLALLALALGHLAIMHMVHSVEEVSYEFVAQRYSTTFNFWRWYDWALLTLALLHGVNGLRTIIDDYVDHDVVRLMLLMALFVGGTFLWGIGSIVVLAFTPVGA
ncbi:MAG: succinate dehydrogenase [Candidatus Omnitrophica bacterium]|nr:succinate dehydrogenase [Candidatus Omnitrophota bacterium]